MKTHQNKPVLTHVTTPIEGYHFTPFATLLFQLPDAIRKVFGYSQFYWSYSPRKQELDVDIYWLNGDLTARNLTCVSFDRIAYSNGQIVDLLSTKKVDNTSIVENV